MNDRYDAGYGGDQYELVGYDEFGQPVYRQVPPSAQQGLPQQQDQQQPYGQGGYASYDPYGGAQQGYGYDPYATGADGQPPAAPYDPYGDGRQPGTAYGGGPSPDPYDPYGAGTSRHDGGATAYDPYGQAAGTGQQPRVAEQTARIPQQQARYAEPDEAAGRAPADGGEPGDGAGSGADRDYRTEQFAFVEEPDGDSEDVIDWMAFTENRTERREEARRRARSRLIALGVVLALVVVGGVGYLWYAGGLPGTSSGGTGGTTTAAGAQNRDVIVVHLHDTKGTGTSTVLLVDNTTAKRGTTVLLPNSLALTDEDGTTTTLAKSVDDDGSSGTREALDTVLGTEIQGTWRLDTPYLNNLVELVGAIEVDTDTDVPDPDAKSSDEGASPLVHKGEKQTLSGRMAVAYATYRAPGESQNAQLERFGQVMQGVLRKLSSDPDAATVTVQTLAQILDPSLTDKDLGTFLAKLADLAKGGDYRTTSLPVQADGTLSAEASDGVVEDVLGGAARSPEQGAAVRVGVRNGTGDKDAGEQARVALVNGGYTFLDAGTASAASSASQVTYADAAKKEDAVEVAKTLGLPTSAVRKGKVTSNADVSVVLGQDYEVSDAADGTETGAGTSGTTTG
ncbi:membrane protein [Streptomyces minutiscleroticus]|uniref:Membrane protein n=1 Tax=Streptomyces minutiscleroticus TaxID=68238 RepID=A0A918N9L4_9ACTN|nr:LCP family protein [Streptomyces minutiscleroticus]GGX51178.1 membrane protein [Streptomyces minutiscleroticus]